MQYVSRQLFRIVGRKGQEACDFCPREFAKSGIAYAYSNRMVWIVPVEVSQKTSKAHSNTLGTKKFATRRPPGSKLIDSGSLVPIGPALAIVLPESCLTISRSRTSLKHFTSLQTYTQTCLWQRMFATIGSPTVRIVVLLFRNALALGLLPLMHEPGCPHAREGKHLSWLQVFPCSLMSDPIADIYIMSRHVLSVAQVGYTTQLHGDFSGRIDQPVVLNNK